MIRSLFAAVALALLVAGAACHRSGGEAREPSSTDVGLPGAMPSAAGSGGEAASAESDEEGDSGGAAEEELADDEGGDELGEDGYSEEIEVDVEGDDDDDMED